MYVSSCLSHSDMNVQVIFPWSEVPVFVGRLKAAFGYEIICLSHWFGYVKLRVCHLRLLSPI